MAKVGHIAVEVRPTVTLESAVACVMMLNLFLAENDEYRLEVGDDGKWHLTDEPFVPATGGVLAEKLVSIPCTSFAMTDKQKETARAAVEAAIARQEEDRWRKLAGLEEE